MANEIFVGGTVQKSDGSVGWSEILNSTKMTPTLGLRVEKIKETVKYKVASVYSRLRYDKNNF
jgi:hypothetical protein